MKGTQSHLDFLPEKHTVHFSMLGENLVFRNNLGNWSYCVDHLSYLSIVNNSKIDTLKNSWFGIISNFFLRH